MNRQRGLLLFVLLLLVMLSVGVIMLRVLSGANKPTPAPTPAPTTSASPSPSPTPTGPRPLRVATYNVLGSSHTGPQGNQRPDWAPGVQRIPASYGFVNDTRQDVVGFQELQPRQFQRMQRLATGWGSFHARGDTENAVFWRKSRVTMVRSSLLPITYFNGGIRKMPVMLFRFNSTGQRFWLINVHNPADVKRFPKNARWRAEAVRRELQQIRSLNARKLGPVLMTGDFNGRDDVYCPFARIGMRAANGGTVGPPCRPPRQPRIDWIFGNGPVRFSNYTEDSRPLNRVSDHRLIYADVAW